MMNLLFRSASVSDGPFRGSLCVWNVDVTERTLST